MDTPRWTQAGPGVGSRRRVLVEFLQTRPPAPGSSCCSSGADHGSESRHRRSRRGGTLRPSTKSTSRRSPTSATDEGSRQVLRSGQEYRKPTIDPMPLGVLRPHVRDTGPPLRYIRANSTRTPKLDITAIDEAIGLAATRPRSRRCTRRGCDSSSDLEFGSIQPPTTIEEPPRFDAIGATQALLHTAVADIETERRRPGSVPSPSH